jgi:hypothetical protein
MLNPRSRICLSQHDDFFFVSDDMLMKTLPDSGRTVPAAIWLLANAKRNVR